MRWMRVLLLLGWLGSAQGISPFLVLAAAVLDGDHIVRVGTSSQGDLAVKLSHRDDKGAEGFHRHDLVCSLIVAFSEGKGSAATDHILSFRSVDDASEGLRGVSDGAGRHRIEPPEFRWAWSAPAGLMPAGSVPRGQEWTWSPDLGLRTRTTVMQC